MDIKIFVGSRIRQIRNTKGISQEALGHLAELDRTYITSVENGKRNISIVNIQKICKALGISISKFFGTPDFNR
ncbi:MAG TPA: helix-turn-helix transcriptional regulator [Candidatus Kapabacteria bacterium]|nr:helix-turn-helix transcriptional regulator [Candidatus Kapabacteria bacterium]